MDNDKDLLQNELSREESKAFEELKSSKKLPATMEDQIVNALINKGLIQKNMQTSKPLWRYLGGAAAAAILFLAGFWIGQTDSASSSPSGETYLLLLHEKQGSIPADDPEISQEYGNWARSLPAKNAFIEGSELDNQIRVVGPWDPKDDSDVSTGYFMIRASSLEEAAKVANGCPHIGHGGSIEVRKVLRH